MRTLRAKLFSTCLLAATLLALPSTALAQSNQSAKLNIKIALVPSSGACSVRVSGDIDTSAALTTSGEYSLSAVTNLVVRCAEAGTKISISADAGLHWRKLSSSARRMQASAAAGKSYVGYFLVNPQGNFWGDGDFENTMPGSGLVAYGHVTTGTTDQLKVTITDAAGSGHSQGIYTDTVTFTLHY